MDKIEALLGSRISEARMAMGFSEKQLAQRLGLKEQTIEKWESGEKTPRANKLHQLAGVLGIPIVWLMGGAETPPIVEAPSFNETDGLEDKLSKAETLINELSFLLADIRASTRRVQRDIDAG
ncbi:MAG: helix-turn-helix domain-containing protein [Granulosicoccus sp.]